MADNKFERCAEDAPDRCQATGREGQCPYRAVPGATMCARHGGVQQQQAAARHDLKNYRLTKWKAKVGEKANNPHIRNLSDEIGIIRVMIEETLELVDGPNKMLMYTDKISNLVGQVQRLVETSQKLDERNAELLPRNIIIVIADSIVTILGQYITDPDALLEVGKKICDVIANAGSVRGADQLGTQP